ncbi:GGDEF domain-containing protein [Konateibacter massiliensis]|uniref:GGDEF domain-containing protein n=1 Tax=Konateibacter massiliensis TaxID=2002841 RepID=UPI000C150FAA|nr:GGDEF domain-containing protein [Konateibacter massiliensis]
MQDISFHSISDSRIPIAITDLKLTLQYGNKSLYTLIGNDLFFSIYKVVLPKDRARLTECIKSIEKRKSVTDVFSILYSDNEYHHMLLNFNYIEANRLIRIEFQYLSDIINEHARLEHELIKYQSLFTLAGDNIFEYDPETDKFKFYWVNDKQNVMYFNGLFSTWKEDVQHHDYISCVDWSVFFDMCESIQNCIKSFEYQLTSSILSDGEIFETTKVKGLTIKNHQHKKIVVGVWFSFNAIHELKENHFMDTLHKDELTGLLNKREITKYAEKTLRHSPENNVYLFIMDLDNFKQCNDTFGHMFGDEILKDVAAILKNTIQQHGVAGRIGGDEFLVILENIDSEALLRNMLRSIRANIQWLYREKLSAFQLGCSMGVTCYPRDGESYDTLFKVADYSLYIAKNKGKNRYIIYDHQLHGPVSCNCADNSILTQIAPKTATATLADVKKQTSLLYSEGKYALADMLKTLKEFYDLHNISIYVSGELHENLSFDDENVLVSLPALFQDDYLAQFEEEEDSYCAANIRNFEFIYGEIYNYFASISSTSYYQCLLLDSEDNMQGIISYERSTIHCSWPNDTRQMLSLISRIIGNVLFG